MKRDSGIKTTTFSNSTAGGEHHVTPSDGLQAAPAVFPITDRSSIDPRQLSHRRLGILLHDWLESIGYRRYYPESAESPAEEFLSFSGNQLREIDRRISHLKEKAAHSPKPSKPILLDNVDLMRLLHISSRTSRLWREKGRIKFSRVGRKLFFRLEDVEEMLERGRES